MLVKVTTHVSLFPCCASVCVWCVVHTCVDVKCACMLSVRVSSSRRKGCVIAPDLLNLIFEFCCCSVVFEVWVGPEGMEALLPVWWIAGSSQTKQGL